MVDRVERSGSFRSRAGRHSEPGTAPTGPTAAGAEPSEELELLETLQALLAELRLGAPGLPARLDGRLEEDLGLHSLARVELRDCIEQQFTVRLPGGILGVVTPRGWLPVLAQPRRPATPSGRGAFQVTVRPPRPPAAPGRVRRPS